MEEREEKLAEERIIGRYLRSIWAVGWDRGSVLRLNAFSGSGTFAARCVSPHGVCPFIQNTPLWTYTSIAQNHFTARLTYHVFPSNPTMMETGVCCCLHPLVSFPPPLSLLVKHIQCNRCTTNLFWFFCMHFSFLFSFAIVCFIILAHHQWPCSFLHLIPASRTGHGM